MNYEIFVDVSVDIDSDVAREENIHYVPMEYMLGNDSFHCTQPESDEAMHHYYEQLRKKIPTRTSQITPFHYTELFTPYLQDGTAILYLALSSGLSDTYNSARMAKDMLLEKFPDAKIEVVDSLGATGGMGLLAEAAAQNRAEGLSLTENAAWLRENASRVHYWFKVEDLMYLKRGGRISAATAVMGTALNLKPILTVTREGKLESIATKRGNKQALRHLIELFEQNYDPSFGSTVYICCADCKKDAGQLRDMLLEKHPELTVRMTMLSPIIGAHTGPDMFALICFGGQK